MTGQEPLNEWPASEGVDSVGVAIQQAHVGQLDPEGGDSVESGVRYHTRCSVRCFCILW